MPPAHLTLRSPYDHQAHCGHKRDLACFGYQRNHLPHLITQMLATDATITDVEHTETIHQILEQCGLLPETHLVDAGDVDGQSQQRYELTLVGPVSQNNQWQAKKGGYDASPFPIDWDAKHAVCPQGKTSVKWTPGTDQQGHSIISVRFGLQDCRACPVRSWCPRSAPAPRLLALCQQEAFEVLHQARQDQQTEAFRKL